jgi:hypothetical protein
MRAIPAPAKVVRAKVCHFAAFPAARGNAFGSIRAGALLVVKPGAAAFCHAALP